MTITVINLFKFSDSKIFEEITMDYENLEQIPITDMMEFCDTSAGGSESFVVANEQGITFEQNWNTQLPSTSSELPEEKPDEVD